MLEEKSTYLLYNLLYLNNLIINQLDEIEDDKMLKIGEFSKLTQVSIRMLRYYDENNLLKPMKVDEQNGYRYYAIEQIPKLQKILFLRNIGFGVAEMEKALAHWDDALIKEQLQHKRTEIEEKVVMEQNKLLQIEKALKDLQEEKQEIHHNFLIKSIPSYPVLSLRKKIPSYFDEGKLWQELSEFIFDRDLQVSENCFAIYHDLEHKEQDVDVEVCMVVAQLRQSQEDFTYHYTEPVELMASSMVYGAFENIAGAYLSFAHWLEQHDQYQMIGKSRQIVHRGPWNEESPNHYLTEMQIPLQLRKKADTPVDSHIV